MREIFETGKVFFATLGYASSVHVQADKSGIGDDAVSAVIPEAVIYMPFAELVDIDKEIERLKKEEERLTKELARVNGMLGNENPASAAVQDRRGEGKAGKIYPDDGSGKGALKPAAKKVPGPEGHWTEQYESGRQCHSLDGAAFRFHVAKMQTECYDRTQASFESGLRMSALQ